MHDEALDWVRRQTRGESWPVVLDIGSRDVNGSLRPMFPDAALYYGIDIEGGPGVDEVANAAEWEPSFPADLVLCTEVFEHTPEWPAIVRTIARAMAPEGARAVITMATDPREPHSGVDGGPVQDGEFYCNVDPQALVAVLNRTFEHWRVEKLSRGDLDVVAESPIL